MATRRLGAAACFLLWALGSLYAALIATGFGRQPLPRDVHLQLRQIARATSVLQRHHQHAHEAGGSIARHRMTSIVLHPVSTDAETEAASLRLIGAYSVALVDLSPPHSIRVSHGPPVFLHPRQQEMVWLQSGGPIGGYDDDGSSHAFQAAVQTALDVASQSTNDEAKPVHNCDDSTNNELHVIVYPSNIDGTKGQGGGTEGSYSSSSSSSSSVSEIVAFQRGSGGIIAVLKDSLSSGKTDADVAVGQTAAALLRMAMTQAPLGDDERLMTAAHAASAALAHRTSNPTLQNENYAGNDDNVLVASPRAPRALHLAVTLVSAISSDIGCGYRQSEAAFAAVLDDLAPQLDLLRPIVDVTLDSSVLPQAASARLARILLPPGAMSVSMSTRGAASFSVESLLVADALISYLNEVGLVSIDSRGSSGGFKPYAAFYRYDDNHTHGDYTAAEVDPMRCSCTRVANNDTYRGYDGFIADRLIPVSQGFADVLELGDLPIYSSSGNSSGTGKLQAAPCAPSDRLHCSCGNAAETTYSGHACRLPPGAVTALSAGSASVSLLLLVPQPELSPLVLTHADGSTGVSVDVGPTRLQLVQLAPHSDRPAAFDSDNGGSRCGSAAITASAVRSAVISFIRSELSLRERAVTAPAARFSNDMKTSVLSTSDTSDSIEAAEIVITAGGEEVEAARTVLMAKEKGVPVVHWLPPLVQPDLKLSPSEMAALLSSQWLHDSVAAGQTLTSAAAILHSTGGEHSSRLHVPSHVKTALQLAVERYWAGVEAMAASNCSSCSLLLLRQASSASHSSLLFAASAMYDPAVTSESYLPPVHVGAVYLPPWAPVIAPLLIAVIKGWRDWWGKAKKKKTRRALLTAATSTKQQPSPIGATEGGYSGTSTTTIRSGHILTIRLFRPSDGPRIRELYVQGQQAHIRDDVSRTVHDQWTHHVLGSDLADIPGHYNCSDGDGDSDATVHRPAAGMDEHKWRRSAFWVATVAKSSYDQLAAAVRKEEASSSGGGGGAHPSGLVPTPSSHQPGPVGSKAFAEEGEQEAGQVIVGCVACKPFVPESSTSGDRFDTDIPLNLPADGHPSTTTTGELVRMCVDGAVRRCGVATALIRHLEAWAASPPPHALPAFAQIGLSTLRSMESAVALYRSYGYSFAGSGQGCPVQFAGHTVHVVELRKPLQR